MIKINSVVYKASIEYEGDTLDALLYLNPVNTEKVRTNCFLTSKTKGKFWVGGRTIITNDLSSIDPMTELELVTKNENKLKKVYGKLIKHS